MQLWNVKDDPNQPALDEQFDTVIHPPSTKIWERPARTPDPFGYEYHPRAVFCAWDTGPVRVVDMELRQDGRTVQIPLFGEYGIAHQLGMADQAPRTLRETLKHWLARIKALLARRSAELSQDGDHPLPPPSSTGWWRTPKYCCWAATASANPSPFRPRRARLNSSAGCEQEPRCGDILRVGVRRVTPQRRCQWGRDQTPALLPMFYFSANHLLLLSRTEYRTCAVLLMRDDSTRRVYRLHDFGPSFTRAQSVALVMLANPHVPAGYVPSRTADRTRRTAEKLASNQ